VDLQEVLESLLGLVGSDEERHVSDVGEDSYEGTETEPLRTITAALAVAATLPVGQRLVVRLHGTTPFSESLIVPSNVTIVGPGTILAASPGPAARIAGTAAAPRSEVVLRDLTLKGLSPYSDMGGAVRIEHADDVKLERCVLSDSRAGRGAGIAVLESTRVVLEKCVLRDNQTNLTALEVDIVPPTLGFPTGDGHGGGAFVRDSDVRFDGCDVINNRALYAGGGVAVANQARWDAAVEFVDCEITANQLSHLPLTPLGTLWAAIAPPSDMGDPIREVFRATLVPEDDELKLLANSHGMNYESGLGGGISLRLTTQNTVIRGCRIGITRSGTASPNLARRGGGVHCYVGAFPTIEDSTIAFNASGGDGGGIGADYFDPFIPGGATRFGISAIAMIPRRALVLNRNVIQGNQSLEDGGGLYVTGSGRPEITGGIFKENRAGEHGGGIRVTYATHLHARGVRFERNAANVFDKEPGGDSEGGGALSARNSDVLLEDCELVLNRVFGFAGGAIYYRSSFEGGVGPTGLIADEHGMFDEIQETAFGYHDRSLRLVDCRAEDDRALGARGAGGFLYALRSPDVVGAKIHGGAERMFVSIEGDRTDVKACTSEYDRAPVGTRKRGAVVIELSGHATGGMPDDRVAIGREVAAIAQSTPAPDQRALVVMPDANAANDKRRATYAGGGFVHGPAPTLTAVDKTIVAAAGGTRVQVTGSGFETGMRAWVGGRAATVAGSTATTIDFDVPTGPSGPADLVVALPSGAQAVLPAALRLVAAPNVTFMSALRGRAGDAITMRGTGLPIGTTVDFLFGANAVTATVTDQDADDELVFAVPAAPGGQTSALVRVTSPTGQQFTRPAAKAFTYEP
jgi:hypothetical protein